ncbi:Lrp/AsnC family transcriptional regulator [Polycladidibacter stylochi]|uniref:Lrp/AsnC family transcriptional regulator n=1 Tax=Polycladidibacter stylochi TaxID=1807766 RepID=UPI00082A251E|nr:Lrp/AsnC family transcriptional regulator [Pseudovibrio stylochi]
MSSQTNLSENDEKIINLLKQDSRRSLTEISAIIGLSRQTIQSRIQRLTDKQTIKRFTIEVDEKLTTKDDKVAFFIKIKNNACEKLYSSIKNWPELLYCYSLTGHIDMLVVIKAVSNDETERLRNKLYRHPSVVSVHTQGILKTWRE